MEGNKDSAELCIGIAERYIREGKRDEAEKYLLKSERLYPTQKAKGWFLLKIYWFQVVY